MASSTRPCAGEIMANGDAVRRLKDTLALTTDHGAGQYYHAFPNTILILVFSTVKSQENLFERLNMSVPELLGMPLSNNKKHQVVIFGGHGSSTLFACAASERAQRDAQSSAACSIFLSRCHAAFLEDCLRLGPDPGQTISEEIRTILQNRDNFLAPPVTVQSNAIVQAVTICLYQLLRYLAEADGPEPRLPPDGSHILESVGVCSGLLPSAVVATSQSISGLIEHGVAAFRLAFYIAHRSVLHGHVYELPDDKHRSWTLIVTGMSELEADKKVERFRAQHERRVICRSAIVSEKTVSVTGPHADLRSFHEWLGPTAKCKFALVNAWYHGGQELQGVAEAVMQDIEERQIRFPQSTALVHPLRSAHEGSLASREEASPNSLARWVVWHMLVHSFDWPKTCQAMMSMLTPMIAGDKVFRPQILSFGPSSHWLLGEFRSHAQFPRLDGMDMSSFDSAGSISFDANHEKDIAIVGMGVHLPDGHGPEELWQSLFSGKNSISETANEDASARTMAARHGGFLDDIWTFDNAFFKVTPREAMSMDPQQRILLQTTQAALDDAGYVPDSTPTFQRTSIGCFVGAATEDYKDNLRDDIDVFYSTGTLRAFLSGKVSFVHALSGPSVVIDTACSSGLVAIHQACRSLNDGDCTTAIAGGVNTISSPDMYLGLDRGHFLSPTGGCRPFDASADGYCRAEGCGVFILKRYADALQENDKIYGLIKGIELNQSGNAHSITHPHSETQVQLFQRLLQKSKIEPSTISAVEAHGTGTQAGDAREIASIQTAFAGSRSADQPLVVSSIKGNIGHAEAASGPAGLAKLLLMLKNKTIPRQANLTQLNPGFVSLEESGIIIPFANRDWQHSKTQPRRAMLNNFGAAGSNAALLLEEHTGAQLPKDAGADRTSYVFNASARTANALQAYIKSFSDFLRNTKSRHHIKDICYTTSARRIMYNHRISLVCTSLETLEAKLGELEIGMISPCPASKAVVFGFSGQGSIYRGMSEGLLSSSPFFRNEVYKCDKIVQDLGFRSFMSYFVKEVGHRENPMDAEDIVRSQCACVALEICMAKLFMSWNIFPTYVFGHSLGEYAALAISGALSVEDTLKVVASRARMMAEKCSTNDSGMICCKVSPSVADQILAFEKATPELAVACRNSNQDCVISGPLEQLEHFEQICKIKPIKARRLDVPYGYHSASIDPILQDLEELGRTVTWNNPTIPVASNVHGRLFQPRDFQANYFARHARQPVRFVEIIEAIGTTKGFTESICLEIGPHPTVSSLLKSNAGSSTSPCYPVLKKDVDAWSSLSSVLSALSLVRDGIDWRKVFEGCQPSTIDLPAYPLSGATFEVPFSEPVSKGRESTISKYNETGFALLPRLNLTQCTDQVHVFETSSAILGPLISGHNVGGTAICPASVYHELAIEAAQIVMSPLRDHVWAVSNMSFVHPLRYDPNDSVQTITLYLTQAAEVGTFEVTIASSTSEEAKRTVHHTSAVAMLDPLATKSRRQREAALIKRQAFYFSTTDFHSTLRTKVLYERMFTRVVRYAKEYHTLKELNVASSNLEGYGSFKLPHGSATKSYIVPPVFTDTLLHTAGFIANLSVEPEEICICTRADTVEILYENLDFGDTFTIYCHLFDDIQGAIVADAFVLDSSGQTIALCCGMEFKKLRLESFRKSLQSAIKPKRPGTEVLEKTSSGGTTAIPSPTGALTPKVMDNNAQDIRRSIVKTLSETSGFSEQDLTHASSLGDLGIDSLMQIEIASALKQAFPGSSIDQDTIATCDTVQSLEDNIIQKTKTGTPASTGISVTNGNGTSTPSRRHRSILSGLPNGSSSPPGSPMVNGHSTPYTRSRSSTLANGLPNGASHYSTSPCEPSLLSSATNEEATPLFCFHDGSGQGSLYGHILDIDRALYAFSDPDFATTNLRPQSVGEMAERYAATFSKVETPAVVLGGWSFGGVVAFEVAQILQRRGFNVRGLVLIDSPYPKNHDPLPEEIVKFVLGPKSSKNGAIKNHGNDTGTNSHLLTEFKANAALLGQYSPPPARCDIKTVILRSRETFHSSGLCGVKYEWLESQTARTEA
ncbi:MAG: hypothetical protein Q9192_004942, partial [Flavoplaca navasiana]